MLILTIAGGQLALSLSSLSQLAQLGEHKKEEKRGENNRIEESVVCGSLDAKK